MDETFLQNEVGGQGDMHNGLHEAPKQFPEFSFIPPKPDEEAHLPLGPQERYAMIGVILGVVAILSWIVIVVGVLAAIAGIVLSVLGLRSAHPHWARTGLALSVLGLFAAVWYVVAAYNGHVNYNYFTTEFWTRSTTTQSAR